MQGHDECSAAVQRVREYEVQWSVLPRVCEVVACTWFNMGGAALAGDTSGLRLDAATAAICWLCVPCVRAVAGSRAWEPWHC